LKDIITSDPASKKPFIISITTTTPSDLVSMLESIQDLRVQLNDSEGDVSRIGIELNTSCPNITASPPPSYNFPSLRPLLEVLSNFFSNDKSLTVGLKLPPYVFERQFEDAIAEISAYSSKVNKAGGDDNDDAQNPFAFLTCTNTLGSSLLFSSQTLAGADTTNAAAHAPFALAPVLGGLAGSALHPLALGNVYTFTALIARSPDAGVRRIAVVGVGGVEDHEGVQRMRRAGARVVGCATALGREGVGVFERLVTVD
jgi:dihydroorotate dehydrogenase (fumarate)